MDSNSVQEETDIPPMDSNNIQEETGIPPHVEYIYALIVDGDQIYPGACGDTHQTLSKARRYYEEAIEELPDDLSKYPVVIVEATTTFKIVPDDDTVESV